jgi:hypothetical protein
MYYLTIEKNGNELCVRKPFDDYGTAIAACAVYYTPKTKRSVLTFTTETINGQFARSYVVLNHPERINRGDEIGRQLYAAAVANMYAFEYTDSYLFLIESEIGVEDAKEEARE